MQFFSYPKTILLRTFLNLSISSLLRLCLCRSTDWFSLGRWCVSTKHIIRNSTQIVVNSLDWNEKIMLIELFFPFCNKYFDAKNIKRKTIYIINFMKYIEWHFTFRSEFTITIEILNKTSFHSMHINWSSRYLNESTNEWQFWFFSSINHMAFFVLRFYSHTQRGWCKILKHRISLYTFYIVSYLTLIHSWIKFASFYFSSWLFEFAFRPPHKVYVLLDKCKYWEKVIQAIWQIL